MSARVPDGALLILPGSFEARQVLAGLVMLRAGAVADRRNGLRSTDWSARHQALLAEVAGAATVRDQGRNGPQRNHAAEWLTVRQTAEALGVSEQYVRRIAEALGGQKDRHGWLIPSGSVERAMKERAA